MTTQNPVYASQAKPWLKYYAQKYIDQTLPTLSAFDFVCHRNQNHLNDTALDYYGRKFTYADLIVNVQGDEPLIAPALIDALVAAFDGDETLAMATVKTRIDDEAEQQNPNNVKVVTDKDGYALYFSRSLLPYPRHHLGIPVYKHIGIYAYRRDFLLKFAKLAPTPLERAESLEQLRALENGYRIKVIETDRTFVGVDTEEDLARVNEIYRRAQENV